MRYVAPTVSDKEQKRHENKRQSKTKYTCPLTGINAWGKPGLVLYTAEGAAALVAMRTALEELY